MLYKHYAKRIPSISYAFGLYNQELQGICTFGFPPNYNYNNGACVFHHIKVLTLELNRLIKNDNLEPNVTSYFVSQSLKLLPKPCCVVSYADPNNGHHGFIYQATNFLYTGVSTPKHQYIMSDGSKFDIRRGLDKKGDIESKVDLLPTHRYLYFCGNKKQVSEMKSDMKMSIYDYPKGDNKKYDTSYVPTIQKILF